MLLLIYSMINIAPFEHIIVAFWFEKLINFNNLNFQWGSQINKGYFLRNVLEIVQSVKTISSVRNF